MNSHFYGALGLARSSLQDDGSESSEAEVASLDSKISITGCDKPPCRLRQKSTVTGEFRFTPTHDIKTLTNSVHGLLAGVAVPFLGVDKTDACAQIYQADGKTKASCPLKAGTEYVYMSKLPILEVYPKIKAEAHWALVADDGSKPVCFSVPVKITS